MRSNLPFSLWFPVLTASVGLAVACGSTSDAELLTPPADGGADATTTSTPDGSTTTNDGGTTSDSGATGDGATLDAGPLVPSDGGITTDAGPGGSTTALSCGAASCTIPGQVCCASRVSGGTFSFACVNGTSCPVVDAGAGGNPPTALACTSAANCAVGEVCCVQLQGNAATSACMTDTACQNLSGDKAVLCDPMQPTVGCQAGPPCSSKNIADWRLPNGFGTCGGQGN